eukprot:TRINITY_DN79464_c0_g1_i1.p1 TRINITY_DN79464_c0_g1~~TRINITY_DN79464_c0_g1_i1.p1  ORF type:complete len:314 (+),score=51.36 TRINITY_DN79464_c0_g1_i1:50-991(+)
MAAPLTVMAAPPHSASRDGLPDPEDPSAWEIAVDRISLGKQIGQGVTAHVFHGLLDGSRQVAVKQIDWDKSGTGEVEQRAFEREVAVLMRACHESLVQFLGIASLERPLRIITEYCQGGCVFRLLHNQDLDLSWPQKLRICLDVAKAMRYLHEFNPQIIHRDLKSLNLLLTDPVRSSDDMPCIKVSDFGLARIKWQAPDSSWGKMTRAAGTCHWMAPEVFISHTYDEKVDLYSFAMILFEVICQEIPFEDQNPADIGRLAVKGHRPDLEAVPAECPDCLRALMMSCWRGTPGKRPSFAEVVPILENVELPPPG